MGLKNWIFVSFWVFLFTLSYTLWDLPQDFTKWKTLLWYIALVSFIRIESVVVKLKIFKVYCIDSASMNEMAPFWGFLGPYSPKYCLILLKMWPEVVSINKKTVFEKSFKILNFGPNEMEWNCNGILNQMKVYSFGPFWSPVYYEKPKSIDKNQNFCKNCILRNN